MKAVLIGSLVLFGLVGCSTTTVVPYQSDQATQELEEADDIQNSAAATSIVPANGMSSPLNCPSKRIEYKPLPAFPAGGYTKIEINETSNEAVVKLKNWPDSSVDLNRLLPNIATDVSYSYGNASGSVAGIFGYGRVSRQIVIDFMKFRSEPLHDIKKALIGYARVGAGLRLIVDVRTDDANISGSLSSLIVSAKASKIDGTISVEALGIDSPDVTMAMPFTVDLSEANLLRVVEALAIVKARLYDTSTTLSPQLIARIECAPILVDKQK